MVDKKDVKDTEYTEGTTSIDRINNDILDSRKNFLNNLERYEYYDSLAGGHDGAYAEVKTAIRKLWRLVRAAMRRDDGVDSETCQLIDDNVTSDKLEDIIECFNHIEEWLDNKKITRPDRWEKFDRGDLAKYEKETSY